LAFKTKRYFRGEPLTTEQDAALIRTLDLIHFTEITDQIEVVGEAQDVTPREVMISPACLKSDGLAITINDFPDGWTFGNEMTVEVTVPIKNSAPCVLSWAVFPDSRVAAVQAAYEDLRAIMED